MGLCSESLVNCKRKVHSLESKFCLEHCGEYGHGHCIYFCEDICCRMEEDFCIKHCPEKGHGHCSAVLCEEKSHEGSEESFCVKHCSAEGHGHCMYNS